MNLMPSRPSTGILLAVMMTMCGLGCGKAPDAPTPTPLPSAVLPTTPWMGIPSAINQVVVLLHESTGWLLNKSEVSIKKAGDVRTSADDQSVADFQIAVQFGGESFETTAKDVPCDRDGIPTEAAIDRLRTAVEDIKAKMKRLQN